MSGATTNYSFPLLDVGQSNKEATINLALQQIDALLKSRSYQGEHTTAPATTGLVAGAMYFNTTTNQLNFLNSSLVWTIR